MFEFLNEAIGLSVETPKSPESIFAAGEYFYIATTIPNSKRGYGVRRTSSMAVVVVVVVVVVPIAIVLVIGLWRRCIDRCVQFYNMSKWTTIV